MFGRCLVFFLLFYGVFGGANFLASMHNYRIVGEFEFENYIPLVPIFSLVYFSGTFFLFLSPFLLRKDDQFIPFFKLLVLELFIAAIFFILLPIEIIDHVDISEDTILGAIFNFNDKANLDYNYFPSLHVTFAFTLSFFVFE
jgi:glucan phosphoethanolaminetransferase (alkaline phosphatase superfamily)